MAHLNVFNIQTALDILDILDSSTSWHLTTPGMPEQKTGILDILTSYGEEQGADILTS